MGGKLKELNCCTKNIHLVQKKAVKVKYRKDIHETCGRKKSKMADINTQLCQLKY